MGRMFGVIRPTRPIASWTVAVPNAASLPATSASARWMFRYTTPISYMSLPFLRERGGEARVDAPRVAFVDLGALGRRQLRGPLDVAPGVVVVVARLGGGRVVRNDHLARQQAVVERD